MFKFNQQKLSEEILSQLLEKLKFRITLQLETTLFLEMYILPSLMFNQFNKKRTWKLIGNKNKIKLLIETLLQESLFIRADLDLKMLLFQETLTTNKMLQGLL